MFYLPAPLDRTLAVVTHSDSAMALAPAIQQIARKLDPSVLVTVHSLQDNLEHETSGSRAGAGMALLLGILALCLASAGIYGVTAYLVSQRTREIGIRIALGAERSGILRWMLSEAMRPVIGGIVIGLPMAAALSLASSKLLLGVHPLDPVAFLALSVFLVAVALTASYLPARRATRVDPVAALRCE